ncbi:MAG TPA: cytochrome c biogenesis protein CcdA [Planctomycetaceae bacterium]|nr:cytochrome c biogenesis protein CcdA [Planctomycetaceae bacterium]
MPTRLRTQGMPLLAALAVCLAALAACPARSAAQPPDDRPVKLDFLGLADEPASGEPAVELRLIPETVRPGQEVTFAVTVRVPRGAYTYSINPRLIGATVIDVTATSGLEPMGERFEPDHAPKAEFEPLFKENVEKHLRDVTWSRTYRVAADASGTVAIAGKLRYQICDASTCSNFNEDLAVSADVAADGRSAAAAGSVREFTHEERPVINEQPGPAQVRAELSPANAQPGERVRLSVTLTVDEGWHTYAMWQGRVLGASPTRIEVASLRGLKPLSDEFTPDREPERKTVELGTSSVVHEVYHDRVTWTQEFEVSDREYGVAGSITYQTCDANRCLTPRAVSFELGAPAAPARPAVTPGGSQNRSVPAGPHSPLTVAADRAGGEPGGQGGPGATDGGPAADESHSGASEVPRALIPFLLAAVGFGFASLLTPCVFPMIPITVSYFLKQSEKEHHRPVTMALVYCGGIVGTFTALGIVISALFGGAAMTAAANNPWLNLFFAGVLVFFALNMLGMFEIRVPGWLLNWTSARESQGGFAGVLFMAFTFTLVSFTCTFAFAGTLLVLASHGEYYWAAVGMLAFSAAFALPFFFLAVFPSYLQKLPKSGGWMNRTKVTMGMIELALVFKFLSVADFSLSTATVVFDYAIVMSAWIILSSVTGLYLLGLFRLPHDTASDHVTVPRFVLALFFLSFGAYLGVGLFASERPRGPLWDNIQAFAPPTFDGGEHESLGPYLKHDGLEYALDYEQALRFARQKAQPVFLDFTGINCVNCRLMEIRMARPELRQRLANFVRVQLYTDAVPPPIVDPDEVASILDKNIQLQSEWYRDTTLPAYAIVTPDLKILARLSGQKDAATFARFLDEGLANWQRVVRGEVPATSVQTVARSGSIPSASFGGATFRTLTATSDLSADHSDRPKLVFFSGRSGVHHAHALMSQRIARDKNVVALLNHFDRVEIPLDGDLSSAEYDRNRDLQNNLQGDLTLPSFVILSADGKDVLARHIGLEEDEFRKFLQSGLDASEARREQAALQTADVR